MELLPKEFGGVPLVVHKNLALCQDCQGDGVCPRKTAPFSPADLMVCGKIDADLVPLHAGNFGLYNELISQVPSSNCMPDIDNIMINYFSDLCARHETVECCDFMDERMQTTATGFVVTMYGGVNFMPWCGVFNILPLR